MTTESFTEKLSSVLLWPPDRCVCVIMCVLCIEIDRLIRIIDVHVYIYMHIRT